MQFDRRWLEPAVAGVAAVIAGAGILAATTLGPGVSTDSVFYLGASDSLRAGDGLRAFDGSPMTVFPPGFPVALAVVGAVVGEAELAARVLNALCVAAIVLLAWLLLRRHVRSTPLRLAGVLAVAGAPALFINSAVALSEPLFLVFVLAAALALERAIESPDRRRWAAVAGFLMGAAFCVRYTGTWFIAAGALILLVANRDVVGARGRLTRAAAFLVAATPLPALVVGRNLGLGEGHPLGASRATGRSVGQNLSDLGEGLKQWLLPPEAAGALRVSLLAVALAVALALVVRCRAVARREPAGRPPLWPLALLGGGYLAFLLASTSASYVDPIATRLLVPAFVPLVVVAVAGLDRLVAAGPVLRTPIAAAVALTMLLWLAAEAQATRWHYVVRRHQGFGYTELRWQHSQLVALLRQRGIRPDYTNMADALFFLTGDPARCWPSLEITYCRGSAPDLSRLRDPRPAHLAWFAEYGRAGPFVPRAVGRRVRLVEVAAVADGRLYRVVPRAP
jgi:dolichyl-phosphate-mannose-protein mannosyltransferase